MNGFFMGIADNVMQGSAVPWVEGGIFRIHQVQGGNEFHNVAQFALEGAVYHQVDFGTGTFQHLMDGSGIDTEAVGMHGHLPAMG